MEYYSKISVEQVEEAIKKIVSDYPYPRKVGEGLWEIAPWVIGGERLLSMFQEVIRKQLHETD